MFPFFIVKSTVLFFFLITNIKTTLQCILKPNHKIREENPKKTSPKSARTKFDLYQRKAEPNNPNTKSKKMTSNHLKQYTQQVQLHETAM